METREPDLGDELTAIAVLPQEGLSHRLSNFPLALKGEYLKLRREEALYRKFRPSRNPA